MHGLQVSNQKGWEETKILFHGLHEVRCLTETPSLPQAGISKAIDSEQWYTRTNPHLSLQVTECFREDCFCAEHSRRRKIKRKKYLKSCIYRCTFVCIYKLDIIVCVEQGTSSYKLHLRWLPISSVPRC